MTVPVAQDRSSVCHASQRREEPLLGPWARPTMQPQGGRAALAPSTSSTRWCGFPTGGGSGLLQHPHQEAGAAPGCVSGFGGQAVILRALGLSCCRAQRDSL